ncbi:hypothetical protein [Propionivibrio dicarboxylicus]|uniref:ACT domain-containing protein n=1 Tax=Propionivibrio dicarboxylicus TaxID=83767 RepID=A0A1G8BW56_9RHOO|nr:hypothetical protein [Propionivibrio dicarboxylicus]SDH37421.1 hypothetical protein SAMN05660652_01612 [Propionivibrio dicarboxylicus]
MTEASVRKSAFPLHVIVIGLHDRPGAAHSVADVFSARGLQMEAFQGTSDSLSPDGHATLLILFRATPERAALVTRVLRRLSSVRDAELIDAGDPRLRLSVLVAAGPTPPASVHLVSIDAQTALAIGMPGDLLAWLQSENAPVRFGAVRLDVIERSPGI